MQYRTLCLTGLGVLVWSPLASGWLSGAIRAGQEITTSRSVLMPQRFDIARPANRAVDHLRSQLAAADTVLSADVLDAIDAIVAPGVDLAAHEKLDTPPALLDPAQRRR